MLIHQVHNSLNSQMFNIYLYQNFSFPRHLHRGFELIFMLEGTLAVTVNNKRHMLTKDDCILITPYQLHSCEKAENLFFVVVFSGSDVGSFTQKAENKIAENPVFTLPPQTKEYINTAFLGNQRSTENKSFCMLPRPDSLTAKGALYATLAEFIKQCELTDRPSKEQNWILDALFYIEKHFDTDITLAQMAKELGYNYEYLSREINRNLGISFKTLLNQYRCERARHLIEKTDDPLTNIALRSGFQSVRSFNRVFKEEMGYLPSELRKNKKK